MLSLKDRVASKGAQNLTKGPTSGRRAAFAPLGKGLLHGVRSINGTVRGQALSRRSGNHSSESTDPFHDTTAETHNAVVASAEGGSCAHSLAHGSRAPADFPSAVALQFPDPASDAFYYDDEMADGGHVDEPGKAAHSCSHRLAWVATALTLASFAPSLLASVGATASAEVPVPLSTASASSWLVRTQPFGYITQACKPI